MKVEITGRIEKHPRDDYSCPYWDNGDFKVWRSGDDVAIEYYNVNQHRIELPLKQLSEVLQFLLKLEDQ